MDQSVGFDHEANMDKKFLIAVEAIYDAALDPSHLPDALQTIADCLGDVGAILLWRRDDGTFGSIVHVDPAARVARVEPGVWWSEFDHETRWQT